MIEETVGNARDEFPLAKFVQPSDRDAFFAVERVSQLAVDGSGGVRVVTKIDGLQRALLEG